MRTLKDIQPIAYINDIGTYDNPFPFEFYFQDIGGVYCIINLLTGGYRDYYIGKSDIGNLHTRLKAHTSPLLGTPDFKLKGSKNTTKAIWQYGRSNFAIILLERIFPNTSKKALQTLETSYIQTLRPCYNYIKYRYPPGSYEVTPSLGIAVPK
jgi:group I intron endonuclease